MNSQALVLEKMTGILPFLKDTEEEVRKQILKHTCIAHIPKGEFIFFEGAECKQMAFILSGTVRVYKPAENGREITLYRLEQGESCVLTASCILGQNNFPAIAVAEEEVEAAVVPSHIFRDWMNRYEIWRTYVFNLLSKRLAEVIVTLEEVAFRRLDIRIAAFLVKLSGDNKDGIRIRHQDIAMELGTSREVVSRILKQLEHEDLISLQRGMISIQDIDRLAKHHTLLQE